MSRESVAIARQLFDDDTFGRIKAFVSNELRYMPMAVDDTSFIRKWSHNLPFFVKIHEQLTDFASEQFGEKLKPSYSFISMYENNGACPLHIDREQCYRTIDYLIVQDDPEPWPILISDYLDDDQVKTIIEAGNGHPPIEMREEIIASNKWQTVELMPNDAVLYSGTNSWHYRPTPLKGNATLAFFHFVQEDFNGSLD